MAALVGQATSTIAGVRNSMAVPSTSAMGKTMGFTSCLPLVVATEPRHASVVLPSRHQMPGVASIRRRARAYQRRSRSASTDVAVRASAATESSGRTGSPVKEREAEKRLATSRSGGAAISGDEAAKVEGKEGNWGIFGSALSFATSQLRSREMSASSSSTLPTYTSAQFSAPSGSSADRKSSLEGEQSHERLAPASSSTAPSSPRRSRSNWVPFLGKGGSGEKQAQANTVVATQTDPAADKKDATQPKAFTEIADQLYASDKASGPRQSAALDQGLGDESAAAAGTRSASPNPGTRSSIEEAITWVVSTLARRGSKSPDPVVSAAQAEGTASNAVLGTTVIENGKRPQATVAAPKSKSVTEEKNQRQQQREPATRVRGIRPRREPVPMRPVPPVPVPIPVLRHAMRHSFAAYGNVLKAVYFRIVGSSLANQLILKVKDDFSAVKLGEMGAAERHTQAACEIAGMALEDVILTTWSPELFCPCAYVALDHEHKWVVLAVRGSLDNADWLTDVHADPAPFLHGWAHRGMVEAARRLAESHLPAVASTLLQYPDYKLVITGHSLGGGVAALLAMLLHENDCNVISATFDEKGGCPMPEDDPRRCWQLLDRLTSAECIAFAPPSLMSLTLAQECSSYVVSVVCGDDIVPTLSINNLQYLVTRVQGFIPLNMGFGGLATAFSNTLGFSGKPPADKRAAADRAADEQNGAAVSEVVNADVRGPADRDHMASWFFVPPGRLIHVIEPISEQPSIELAEPMKFAEIRVSSRMFSDHLPATYMTALHTLTSQLQRAEYARRRTGSNGTNGLLQTVLQEAGRLPLFSTDL